MLVLMSLFLLPFTVLTHLAARKAQGLEVYCAPGFWLLTEVLRNYLLVNGFPWASLGYSQANYLWIVQISDLGGVYLLSFLIVVVNCSIYAVFRYRKLRYLAIVLSIFILANLYGAYRIHLWRQTETGNVRVGLVQGNISLAETDEYYAERYFEALPRFFQSAVEQGAQWIVFPEAQNPFVLERDFYFRTFWEKQVSRAGVYLLLNSAALDAENPAFYYNSAQLLGPSGKPVYRYDKVHLVPFGEYLPLKGLLGFAGPLVKEVSGFKAGDQLEVGSIGDIQFATLICYEAIFPELSRGFVAKGAQILVNITNDAWFGKTAAPAQHLQMAQFRAIENRRTLLRAANSGFTGVVSPLGRLQQRTDLFREALVMADVRTYSTRTLFSVVGDRLSFGLIILTVGVLLLKRRDTSGRRD
jgi:apolipoprotein N-acyltransferase